MSDLIERLRRERCYFGCGKERREAADEIERLREANQHLWDQWTAMKPVIEAARNVTKEGEFPAEVTWQSYLDNLREALAAYDREKEQ